MFDMLKIGLKRFGEMIPGIPDLWNMIRHGRTGSRLSVSGISNRLLVLAESLEKTYKATEPNFMQTGQELQSVFSEATGLAKDTTEIAKLFTGDSDENLLDGLGRLVRKSVSGLKTGHADISGSLKNIDAGAEYLGTLYSMSPQIERTASFLHIVGLNIGIESSRSEESREMFDIFVHEIKQLASKIVEISEGISDGAKIAKDNQASAQEKITKGLNLVGSLTVAAEETVKGAVDEIGHLMNRSVQVLEQIGGHSKEISRQTSEIVVSIQFDDIARQQIEHISSALADVGRSLNEVTGRGSNGTEASAMGRAQSIISIQKGQLRQVISEIDEAYRKISNAFGGIGNEVRGLVKSSSAIGSKSGDVNSSEDSFAALRSGIEHLHGLITQGKEMGSLMREAADQASAAASSLSKYVEEVRNISLELHLKALNAIIKSTHLGEEYEALEVLSHEVTRLSRESDAFVESVLDILGSINGLAQKMSERSFKNTGRLEQENRESSALNKGIGKVSYAYSQLEKNSRAAVSRSQGLRTTVSEARDSLGFLPELTGRLGAFLEELEEMEGVMKGAGARDTNLSHEDIEDVVQGYTMESERDIARQRLLGVPAEPVKSSKNSLAKKALSESAVMFGDDSSTESNVEMFGDEPAAESNVEMFGDDSSTDSNVELFGDEPAADSNVELFGDEPAADSNVELFGDEPAVDSNVELFGDEPAVDSNVELFGDELPANSNVELFGDDPTADDEDEKSEEKESLGDNVELF